MTFYPPLDKQAEIHFSIAKWLSYRTRMTIVAGLLVLGIAIQILGSFAVGWFCLAAAMLLGMVRGYNATPVVDADSEKWSPVTPDEIRKIRKKQQELRAWDSDFFDITNVLGFFGFLMAVGFVVAGAVMLHDERLSLVWLADSAILILPHWFVGIRRYLKQPKLVVKADLLDSIILSLNSPSDIQARPMLATKQTAEGKLVPVDVRLMLRLVGAPEWFIGIQIQICINTIQGSDFPYLYCVLLGKREADFLERFEGLTKINTFNTTVETHSEGQTDIIVVRQATSKNSGYHTKPADVRRLVETSVEIARRICRTRLAA